MSELRSSASHDACEKYAHKEQPSVTFALITCSDTRDESQDTAGASLKQLIAEAGWQCASYTLVKDERVSISSEIIYAADVLGVDVVITCGGTGLSPRDVTPEATRDVCERDVPGIAESMRAYSLQITPHAMLSRAVCMQRGNTLVINFPGSKKAVCENWEAVVSILPHAVSMMAGCGH